MEQATPEKIREELGKLEQALIEVRISAGRNFDAAAELLTRRYAAMIQMLRDTEAKTEE